MFLKFDLLTSRFLKNLQISLVFLIWPFLIIGYCVYFFRRLTHWCLQLTFLSNTFWKKSIQSSHCKNRFLLKRSIGLFKEFFIPLDGAESGFWERSQLAHAAISIKLFRSVQVLLSRVYLNFILLLSRFFRKSHQALA